MLMDGLTVDKLKRWYADEVKMYKEEGRLHRIIAFISGFNDDLAHRGVDVLTSDAHLQGWIKAVKKAEVKKGAESLWSSQHCNCSRRTSHRRPVTVAMASPPGLLD